MSNPKNNTDVSIIKYASVLEDYHRLSKEHKELQNQFQAEYNFAEEKVKEVKLYEEFINSNEDIKSKYAEFIQKMTEEK